MYNVVDVWYEPLSNTIGPEFSKTTSEWLIITSKVGSYSVKTPEGANIIHNYLLMVLKRKSLYYNLIFTGPLF